MEERKRNITLIIIDVMQQEENLEGYDNAKIAQITGKSIGAIKALQFGAEGGS